MSASSKQVRLAHLRAESAVKLALEGVPNTEIARLLNIDIGSVSRYLTEARQKGRKIPYAYHREKEIRDYPKMVRIRADVAEALAVEAKARNYRSSSSLAHDLLARIVKDELINAILDEEAE